MGNEMKRALITGITGQDGSYLTELLLAKGYVVHGIVRRSSSMARTRLEHIYGMRHFEREKLYLEYGDMTDGSSLRTIISRVAPDDVYNLASQSNVRVSFDTAAYSVNVADMGCLRLLEALRDYQKLTGKAVRYYQASSSEMFGSTPPPQNEETPFHPRSPYAIAKVAGYWHTVNYREAYRMHCSNGILFNHESERRGENFVTRKITLAAARIKVGLQKHLYLGNLEAKRDWGHARDYVEAMWLMLQQEEPDDYVVATGESRSVSEFLQATFGLLGLHWQDYVKTDAFYLRPAEVDFLQGDASKARKKLGWVPKISFDEMVRLMTEHDLELAERELHAQKFHKA
jgi:GDPmannose 4,6-dehydratase